MYNFKLVLSFLIIIIVIYIITMQNETFGNVAIDKIYCINLKTNNDRWENINTNFKKNNLSVVRFDAVDCTSFEKGKQYYNLLSEIAIQRLNKLEQIGHRTLHEELSPGAIGCYLSHYAVWKTILENNLNNALIFEDDANLSPHFSADMNYYLNKLPDNWDIVLFGYDAHEFEKYDDNFIKIKTFFLMHCYIINKKCIKMLLDLALPINYQIDSFLSNISDKINIYGTKESFCLQNNSFKTTIQVPIKLKTLR